MARERAKVGPQDSFWLLVTEADLLDWLIGVLLDWLVAASWCLLVSGVSAKDPFWCFQWQAASWGALVVVGLVLVLVCVCGLGRSRLRPQLKGGSKSAPDVEISP